MRRNFQNSSSIKNINKKPSIFLKILFYLILIAFLGTIIYVLFFSGMLKVLSIDISGNENIETKLILNRVNSKIEGKYLGFIEKNNLFLIGVSRIKNDIKNKFKGLNKIEIVKKFPDKIKIFIEEKNPSIIFCNLEKCLVLDEFGQAYDNADSFLSIKDKDSFLKVIDQSSKEINLGDFILDEDYINYVKNIEKEVKFNFDFKLKNEFVTPNIISNNIRVKTEKDWEIYFNKEVSLEREIKMLKAVLKNNLESQEKRNNLEYIDLRIDGKIFYSFREGTPERKAKEAQIKLEKELEEKTAEEKKEEKEGDEDEE